nr:PREDICTED: 15-hydroxyprostaglandin dehydrogenase [NAD(+)]-like isoform X1 [Saccoglossus kowalevskii]
MTYNDNDVSTFIEVLLSAAIRGTYLGVDFMGKTNGGNGGLVINTGSMAGLWPVPIIPCYCAAKAGLIHFTRSAAEEPMLQQNGIRINVICLDNVDVGPHRFDAMKRFKYGQILENVTKERKSLSLSEAVSGFIRVIEDESLNGSVVSLLVDKGYEVMEFPEITMS